MAFILVAIIPSLILGVYLFQISNRTLIDNIYKSNLNTITTVKINIENNLQQTAQITNWFFTDRSIQDLLARRFVGLSEFDETKKQAINSIEWQYAFLPILDYAITYVVVGVNGLELRNGSASILPGQELFDSQVWADVSAEKSGKVIWSDIIEYRQMTSPNNYYIPQYRNIYSLDTGNKKASVILFFEPAIFSDTFEGIDFQENQWLFLINEYGSIIASNDAVYHGTSVVHTDWFHKLQQSHKDYIEIKDGDLDYLIIKQKLDSENWWIVEKIPMTVISSQRLEYTKTLLLIIACVAVLIMFFVILLSNTFSKPINKLIDKVKKITMGEFDANTVVEADDDLGHLSQNISIMERRLNDLILENIEKENEKRLMSIELLQYQINPHFVYNTLNSIKWMATMQGAEGIVQIVTRFSRLLRSVLCSADELIPLEEELRYIDDYVHIQKIKYKGKIRLVKDDMEDSLYGCKVFRFMLQPIVENAIFHGIEPKEGIGTIRISVVKVEEHVVISIRDDGVGMSPENMDKLFDEQEQKKAKGLNQIGIYNINKRIKLTYGDSYGLEIKSDNKTYTDVIIRFPYIEGEKK